jgi:F-type H+-transporting ATPase subunit gamma
MEMVAAARVRRAQAAILGARPFAVKLAATVSQLAALEVGEAMVEGRSQDLHPLFKAGTGDAVGLLLVTADKGLCGAFNANLLRATVEWIRGEAGRKVFLFVVGRKGRDFVRRLRETPIAVEAELAGIFPKVTFAHAEILGKSVMDAFIGKSLRRVDVLYTEFRSVAFQSVVRRALLPMAPPGGKPAAVRFSKEYRFEPGRQELLDSLLPRVLKAEIFRILLESQAAELAARMNAMDAASKNAGELIGAFSLRLNRTRQAMITKEIAEVVGGAEALAQ